MTSDRPALRERFRAVAVCTAIFLAGGLGVDALVTGKFDVLTPGAAAEAPAPQAWYDRPLQPGQGWYSEPYNIDAYVTQTSLSFENDMAGSHSTEALEGDGDVVFAAAAAEVTSPPDEGDLQAEIAALLAEPHHGSEGDFERAPTSVENHAAPLGEKPRS